MNRRTNKIDRSEILDLGDYERSRDTIRSSAIATRRLRRVELGPNATVAFENHETVRYQIQEMLRAERIAKPEEVDHEIETYSDLLPGAAELSATVMFEFPEAGQRALRLADLRGFEDALRIDFGAAGSAKAFFDRRQIDEERLSAVQFVRFPLSPDQVEAIRSGTAVRLVSDHSAYPHALDLPSATVQALAADLAVAAGGEV
jgi:hypothetical protein